MNTFHHPNPYCKVISDAILEKYLKHSPKPRNYYASHILCYYLLCLSTEMCSEFLDFHRDFRHFYFPFLFESSLVPW